MFVRNIKVVGQKMTKLWSFYVLCLICIFGIEKVKFSTLLAAIAAQYQGSSLTHWLTEGCKIMAEVYNKGKTWYGDIGT